VPKKGLVFIFAYDAIALKVDFLRHQDFTETASGKPGAVQCSPGLFYFRY
jgi:hypothetical protein